MDLNNVFVKKYIEQAVSNLKLAYPNKTEKELKLYVEEKLINTEIKSKYSVYERNPKNEDTQTTMLDVLVYLEEEKPIITGFGALYEQHSSGTKNILLEMVKMLLDTRKVYKKKKLEHANDSDKSLFKMFDKYQLTFKLLANSFFGATGQPQSIFFDPYFPSAIMYTGQVIIMTAIVTFEKITGNFYFNSLNDALLYISRILNSNYICDINELNIIPTKEEVYDLILSKFEGKYLDTENKLKDVIFNLNQTQLTKIYYKNNLLKLLDNDIIKNVLETILCDNFLDPNKPPAEIKDNLYKYWYYIKDYCMYENIPINRTEFCHNHVRKTVLVVN